MNIKKYLQARADKDAEAHITEEDKLFIQQLISRQQEEEIKKKKPKCRRRKKV